MGGKLAARFVIAILGAVTAVSPVLSDARPVLAAGATSATGAIVPYAPPTGGAYQDSRPYQTSTAPNGAARIATASPPAGSAHGFVPGVSREMPLARTANQNVYLNPDGTYTARIYDGAVNYQAAPGDWRPIDSHIVADANGGFRNAAGPFAVHFAADSGAASLFEVQSGSSKVGVAAPQGSRAAPATTSGSTITYTGVAPNTDLLYIVGSDRVKELIVLQQAPAGSGPVRFTFPIQLNGLTAVVQAGGGIGIFKGSTEVFEIPTGQMSDSKVDPSRGGSVSVPVAFSVTQTPTGQAITVEADGAWLRDPARQYPVSIDPTVANFGGTGDAYVRNDYPNLNQGHVYNSTLHRYEDNAGYYDSTTGTEITYMHYDLSAISRQRIISATLNIYFIWSYYVSGYTTYWIHPVTSGWNASTVTWNTRPGVTGDTITDSAVRNVWRTVNMTSWVQNWTSGSWNNNGIEIDENGNGTAYWKKIAADDNTDGSRGYIQVNYEGYNVSIGFQNSDTDPPTPGYPSYAGPAPNTAATLPVQVTNHGTDAWPQNGVYRLSYHLLDRNGVTIAPYDLGLASRTYMWKQVNPGDTILLNAVILPTPPGSYILRWDMAHEGINWFSAFGAATADFKVFVANAPTLLTPADKSVITDADRTSLIVNTTATASSSAAAKHLIEVSPSPTFDAGLVVSAPQTPAVNGPISWSTPAGALKDGARYYWKVVANDGVADSAATVYSFDMDSYQFGQRPTWPMASLTSGGWQASANLATGNLALSLPGISLPTVSHPLSMGVTYNSYAALLGAYVDDRLPFGAVVPGGCDVTWDQGRRFFGIASVVVPNATGIHQDCFQNATETYATPANSSIEVYVYIDPSASPPTQELMLQFFDSTGSWEHRAYWGSNVIPWGGNPGTAAHHFVAPLPPAGQWTRLVIKASDVGLPAGTGSISGMAFSLVDGRAWFDHDGLVRNDLSPGFELGNNLEQGGLSLARLGAYDGVGSPIAAGDLSTRVDRVEVRETDGSTWVFRNRVPAGTSAWPQFDSPPGVSSSLARDIDGSWSVTGQDGLTYDFAPDGTLRNLNLDENQGAQPSFHYGFDASVSPARLTDITDPLSRKLTIAYGANGRVSSFTSWDGRTVSFGYDPNTARLIRVTDPSQSSIAFGYQDLDGQSTSGRVAGVIQTATNGRNNTSTFGYGDANPAHAVYVSSVTGPAPTAATRRFVYNSGSSDILGPRCLADATTCPQGFSQRFVYDNRHRTVQSIDTLGKTSSTAYDTSDRVLLSADATGARQDTTYDSEGRQITTIAPAEAHNYGPGTGLYAEYYNNQQLGGTPTLSRVDQTIDFNWGSTGPPSPIHPDDFSVRWTGYLQVPAAGAYTLYASSDDGTRLRVGAALAIDDWNIRSLAEPSATLQLPAGNVPINLEYFQAYGATEVHLSWAGPGIAKQVIPAANMTAVRFATTRTLYDENITGLRGSYFNNMNLAGRPTVLRTDSPAGSFAFNWNSVSPDPSLPTTNYSVRWSGVLQAPASGNYRIGAIADDGVRIYVDGTLQLDHWSDSAPAEYDSPSFFLARGIHKLVVEYYQHLGGAVFTLRWQRPADSATVDVPSSSVGPNYGLATTGMDPNDHVTSYSYSGGGLDPVRGLQSDKTTVNIDADGTPVTYTWHTTYDAYARTTSSTTAKGMTGGTPDPNYTRTDTYYLGGDANGRDGFLQSVTTPGQGTTTYDYERPTNGSLYSSGWVIQKIDQHGTWTYGYDALGNQIAVTPPGRTLPTVSDFDADNNLTRVSDPQGGTIAFMYDEMDRLTLTSVYDTFYGLPTPQQTPDATSSATYDSEGHPQTVTDGAGVTAYTYDERGSIKTMTDPAQRQASFAYDDAGRLKTKTLPNGTVVHYFRDPAGRVTNLQNHLAASEAALANADYIAVYDPAGKIMSVAGPDGTNSYTYDTIGRLETWTDPATNKHRYYFDLNSNRTQLTINGARVHSYGYAANLSDQLTSVDGQAYGYNAAGDTIGRPPDGSRPAQTLGWEPHGNIQSVTSSDNSSVTFVRDALGRVRERIQKDPSGGVISDTRFRFTGSDSSAAYETDVSNNVTKSYLSGPEGLTVVYAGNRSGSASFVYVDIHGNVVLTADASGSVTGGPYTYDPFGNNTGASNPGQYGFVGKWQKYTDQFSGLVLMGARPYDPTLGRFLSVDPVADGSGNLYDYAGQDPINAYDLDGNKCHGWFSLCTLGFVARVVSIVPGPIGMIAAGVSVGAYLAAGEYGEAAGSALAFLPGGVLLRAGFARLGGAKLLGLATRVQFKAPIIGAAGPLFGKATAIRGTASGILNRWRTGLRIGWTGSKDNTGFAFGIRWGRKHLVDLGVTDGYRGLQ